MPSAFAQKRRTGVEVGLAKDNPMTRAEVVAKAHDLITLRGRKKGRRFRRPFLGDDYRGSEVQTQLALEHSASGLRSELTPRNGSARSQVGVDRETRIEGIQRADGLRMVQHVECIHAELEPLRFREPERFGQIRVEAPNRESWEDVLAQVPALSRLRILEDDQARISAAIVERNGAGRARRNNL